MSAAGEGNNLRNIIALQDLGEAQIQGINDDDIVSTNLAYYPNFFTSSPDTPTAILSPSSIML